MQQINGHLVAITTSKKWAGSEKCAFHLVELGQKPCQTQYGNVEAAINWVWSIILNSVNNMYIRKGGAPMYCQVPCFAFWWILVRINIQFFYAKQM